jgi:hydroxymethylbilane synthase
MSALRLLRVATRSSPLALWQARHVARQLQSLHPQLRIHLVPVVSSGDADRSTPLYGMGTEGIFVKEIQNAVLRGDADAGVHSCKDLPTSEPEGLALAAILKRHDPRDVLIGADGIAALPKNAVVGTSSLRRQAQLKHLRPDLQFTSIRGNIETRLRKVAQGEVAATVMAFAGLARLELLRRARAIPLDPVRECTPAPGQGAIAIDCRANDRRTRFLLSTIADHDSAVAVGIERAVLAGLRGGCSLPLACLARRDGARWRLEVRLGQDSGVRSVSLMGASGELSGMALAALSQG